MLHAQSRSTLLRESPDAHTCAQVQPQNRLASDCLLPLTFSIVIGFVASCFPANAADLRGNGWSRQCFQPFQGVWYGGPENRYARLNANPAEYQDDQRRAQRELGGDCGGEAGIGDVQRHWSAGETRSSPVAAPFGWPSATSPSRTPTGTSATTRRFIAAYRKFVTVIRSTGEHNVQFVWQMTSYSFQVQPRTTA